MASRASFLSAEAAATASVAFTTNNGTGAAEARNNGRRRGGRVRSSARPSYEIHHQEQPVWIGPPPMQQRLAVGVVPGTGKASSRAGPNVHSRPGMDGVGSLHHNLQSQGALSAEFCGRRSTRLVSKFHHGRQKLYLGKHSPEADMVAERVLKATSAIGTAALLDQWSDKLVCVEDFPYLLRELGNWGAWEKALKSFEWMLRQARLSGEWSKLASIMISTLGRLGKVDLAQEVFNNAQSRGFGDNVYAYSALVSAYGRSGRCKEALDVFQLMKKSGCKPNLITYNTIIDACGKGGVDLNKALEIFDEMQREGVEPDRITFNSLIAVCSRGSLWEESQKVFAEMQRRGIEQDIFTYNTLIDAVCKGGQMELAASIVAAMRHKSINPNVVTYSTMIDGYGKIGCFDQAINLYHEMKDANIYPDRVSYNTLVDIYAKLGRFDDALATCTEMERAGWKTDVVTYNALIDAYGKQGKYDDASKLFDKMKSEGVVPNVLTYSALIDAYSKGGRHREASEVFQQFKKAGLQPDVVLYSALIDAYFKNGLVNEAVALLEEMMKQGIQPNIVTYNSLIDAYGRRGEVDKAWKTLESSRDDNITPDCTNVNTIYHQHRPRTVHTEGPACNNELIAIGRQPVDESCIPVDRNKGKHGNILAAVKIFHDMQESGLKPNVVTFSAILNACSRCASFEEASVLLEEMRLFDSRVYGVAYGLLMGSREHVWGEAEVLFNQIAFMDYATAAAFYNALTDVLWHFGQREGAQKVAVAAKRRRVWENAWWRSDQQFCLDLHLMSVGAAQAMLHVWLLDIRSLVWEGHELPRFLSILTGWGKHSKVAGASAVKKAVETRLMEIGAPFQVAKYNEGRLISAGRVVYNWLRDAKTLPLLLLQDSRQAPYPRREMSMPDLRLLSLQPP
ncbi:pentatricopeptide repeat domain-containing protein 1 [Marchantia polymorpha subsp. ruderalis]|uniref:Smr domain-containing protein n=2 Tax=Marchantia polymorpha TaxID=3197 RepID=A0A176VZ89_MARPO|nr:hypothetical protein AXG93_1298s1060 [Marchantia polymorpha subsp. ruderalis]PTQ41103.1 hypothetical protein MARPO_0036s0086 [Marchantia polymorpha]BBM97800.1 hypothetical protein Mp_1g08430 [Marchantia polymorpha subsp. ruderalis]|eukprot:PTQ41103.1 hypothetical protein MARPO_0036s0086 [Marchantia polymorpha]